MLRLTQTDLTVPDSAIPLLREEFQRTGCAMLPGFLTPAVLELVMRKVESAEYEQRFETSPSGRIFGTTFSVPLTDGALGSLCFLLNRPALFRAVAQISGCPTVGNYAGRIHRTIPGEEQHIDWHHDVYDFRVAGLNINLSREPFTGGVFELRGPDTTPGAAIANWRAGDAFLFKIDEGWQHRLTRVAAGERTVGVGWFRTRPDWEKLGMHFMKTGIVNLMAEESTQS